MIDRNKLFEDNMKLTSYTILTYFPQYVGDEDILQEAYIGLFKASQLYDPEMSAAFSTYAVTSIYRYLCRQIRYHNKYACNEICSLDSPIDFSEDDSPTLADRLIGSEDVEYVDTSIPKWVDQLCPNRRTIAILTAQGMKQKEIAAITGVTNRRVSQQLKQIGKDYLKITQPEKYKKRRKAG